MLSSVQSPPIMPLPQSVTCSACRHTYPDGWKRCPYCGHDPIQAKRDAEIARQARAAAPQRGRQEQPRGKGQPRAGAQGRGPGQEGQRTRGPRQDQPPAGRPGAPQRTSEPGSRPQQPGNAQPQRPAPNRPAENGVQKAPQEGDAARRSRRPRRRGRRSGQPSSPGDAAALQAASPRVESSDAGVRPPEAPSGEPKKSRKRFRRRRRGGENKGPTGAPPGPATT